MKLLSGLVMIFMSSLLFSATSPYDQGIEVCIQKEIQAFLSQVNPNFNVINVQPTLGSYLFGTNTNKFEAWDSDKKVKYFGRAKLNLTSIKNKQLKCEIVQEYKSNDESIQLYGMYNDCLNRAAKRLHEARGNSRDEARYILRKERCGEFTRGAKEHGTTTKIELKNEEGEVVYGEWKKDLKRTGTLESYLNRPSSLVGL